MTTTDTSERGLERLICTALTGHPCDPNQPPTLVERPSSYGAGWLGGFPQAYDREYCLDLAQLSVFLHQTQPESAKALGLTPDQTRTPPRAQIPRPLASSHHQARHDQTVTQRRQARAAQIDLFYGTPSPGNAKAVLRYGQNRFSVTRQLRYSRDQAQLALDLCLFINGMPRRYLRTQEQPHQADRRRRRRAVQARPQPARKALRVGPLPRPLRHRRPRGAVLHPPRRQGLLVPALQPRLNDGAGNPPNPNGLMTDYLLETGAHA